MAREPIADKHGGKPDHWDRQFLLRRLGDRMLARVEAAGLIMRLLAWTRDRGLAIRPRSGKDRTDYRRTAIASVPAAEVRAEADRMLAGVKDES